MPDTKLSLDPSALDPDRLHLVFSGGVKYFGRNNTVFSYQNTNLYIDLGIGFSNHNTPGMARLLPPTDLFTTFPPAALVLTHAHEDHIGALPYIIKHLPLHLPVYGTPFTLKMVKNRLLESGIPTDLLKFHPLSSTSGFDIGPFTLKNLFMPHSIPDAYGLLISVAGKKIFYTGDFKLTGDAPHFNKEQIQKVAPVDYLFIDSTGSLSRGGQQTEEDIGNNIESLVSNAKGRVFITTFSSQIERIKTIYRIVKKTGRALGLKGRSLSFHLEAAFESGSIETPFWQLPSPLSSDKKGVWLISGCQGEYRSSFWKLAHGLLPGLDLNDEDLLIYSASIIPGNHGLVFEALNLIAEKGTSIAGLTDYEPKLHISGHASATDIATMIKWVKPDHVIPIHGDPIHFSGVEKLAKEAGVKETTTLRNYDLVQLTPALRKLGEYPFQTSLMEPGEIHNSPSLYTYRKNLSTEGICTLVIEQKHYRLLAIDHVAVATEKTLNEVIPVIKEKIEEYLAAIAVDPSKTGLKKLKQKIARLHMNHLRKEPFIQLIFI